MFPRLAACANQGESDQKANPHLAGPRPWCEVASPKMRAGSEALPLRSWIATPGTTSRRWSARFARRSSGENGQRSKPTPPRGSLTEKHCSWSWCMRNLRSGSRAGEPLSLVQYLDRFPELSSDPAALRELIGAEADWRRRVAHEMRGTPEAPAKAESTAKPPVQISRYDLENVIGQGACGVVYRAWDTVLNRPVALKRPRAGDRETPEAIERFVREARSTAALRHPHIVPIYDAGQFDGQSYLVSALVEGQNLADTLTAERPSFRQSAEWVASLADALDHAHQAGVIHRDLKPSNVLIDQEDRAHLTDFGLAKSESGQATLTKKGQIIGTPAYMAPEQAAGNERVDRRADVYCLGVIFYELLTGVRPFYGSEPVLLARIRDEDPRPPRRLDQSIPRDLETVCLKAMAKQPGHRYPDAASFAADLRRYLRGEPVRARRVGALVAFWWKCRRKPLMTGLAASLVFSMASTFAGITWQWRRAEHQRAEAVNALTSAHQTIQFLVEFSTTAGGKAEGDTQQARRILDSLIGQLVDRARAYPEIRLSLISATEGSLNLVDRILPRGDALSAHEKARTVLENLARDDPKDLPVRDTIARSLGTEAHVLLELGRLEEGEARLRRSLAEWRVYNTMANGRSQADRTGAHRSAREAWIGTSISFSALEARLGRRPEAIASLREVLPVAEELSQESPTTDEARRRLIAIWSTLASIEDDADPAQGIPHGRCACELLEQICGALPSSTSDRDSLAEQLWHLAKLEDRIDCRADAIDHLARAAAVLDELLHAEHLRRPWANRDWASVFIGSPP